jgi:hypothetical protein
MASRRNRAFYRVRKSNGFHGSRCEVPPLFYDGKELAADTQRCPSADSMTPRSITLNRWLVGIATIGCFAASVIVAIAAPSEQFWWGGLLRAGVVLGALWACPPTKTRPAAWADFSPWAAALFGGTLLLAILRPRVGIPAVVVLLVLRYLFTPRRRRG